MPGTTYYASVSAINAYGIGAAKLPTTTSVTPPKQIPEPPSNVALSVHDGSSTTLDVTYDPPTSDGGADILNYRIELDTGSDFSNPIYSQVYCAAANTHSIWEISISSTSDIIAGGYFTLTLERNGEVLPLESITQLQNLPMVGFETLVNGVAASFVTSTAANGADINSASSVQPTRFELMPTAAVFFSLATGSNSVTTLVPI